MPRQTEKKDEKVRIFAGNLVSPGFARHDVVLGIEGGKITEIASIAGHSPAPDDIDARKHTVTPGLIDIHCHGAMGEEFFVDCSQKTRAFMAGRGTTGFLATSSTGPREGILTGLGRLRQRIAEQKPAHGAQILGIRCEGPFLEPSLGAQRADLCWPVNKENISVLLDAAGPDLRVLDVSPELPGAETLIREAVERGIIVTAAHTRANAEQMEKAFKLGLSHVTHIFNATERPLAKGGLGTLGVGVDEFALTCDGMTAEVIADCQGFHVNPYWLDILLRCKGKGQVAVISDGVSNAGREPGRYELNDGRWLTIRPGEDVCRLETGPKIGLCGSAMTVRDSLRNLMRHLQMNLEDAIDYATLNPARILRLEQQKGSIEVGKDADLLVLDEHLEVVATIIAGQTVYTRAG